MWRALPIGPSRPADITGPARRARVSRIVKEHGLHGPRLRRLVYHLHTDRVNRILRHARIRTPGLHLGPNGLIKRCARARLPVILPPGYSGLPLSRVGGEAKEGVASRGPAIPAR